MACPRPSPVTCGGIRFQAAQRERAAIKPPSEPALSPCPQRPLEERRDKLSRLIHGVGNVLFSEALSAEGSLVFAKACELGVWRGSCRSAQAADIGAGRAAAGSSRRTRPLCGSEGDRKSGVGRRGDQSAVREAPAQPNCLTRTCLHVDVAACLREGPAVRRDAPAPASKGSALVEMSTSSVSKSRSVRGDLRLTKPR